MLKYAWDKVATELSGDRTFFRYFIAILMAGIKEIKNKDIIVDIGCGQGIFLEILRKNLGIQNLLGVDISSKLLRITKSRIPNIDLIQADAHHLPFRTNVFDLIFSLDSIEHWLQPIRGISEISRIVKPHGKVVITTITYVPEIVKALRIGYYSPQPVEKAINPLILRKIFKKLSFKLLAYAFWGPSILRFIVIVLLEKAVIGDFIRKVISYIRIKKKLLSSKKYGIKDSLYIKSLIRWDNNIPMFNYLIANTNVVLLLQHK